MGMVLRAGIGPAIQLPCRGVLTNRLPEGGALTLGVSRLSPSMHHAEPLYVLIVVLRLLQLDPVD